MNYSMIAKLIHKDWLLLRWYFVGYTLLGILAAGLMAVPSYTVYYTGVVTLITVLIGASAHIVFALVIIEKKEYQMSFIMALPLSPKDYFLSKLLGGLVIYLAAWLPIVIITVGLVLMTHLPNGMIPMILISAMEILVALCILLSVSILVGTEAVTIIVMVLLNLLFNLFLFSVGQMPGISEHINGETAVFNTTALSLLGIELLLIAVIIMFTGYMKSRKPCFL